MIFPVLSTPLETQNYAYTLQGWIKGVSGQHFSYALGYNNTDYAAIGATPSAALYVLTGGKDLSFGANSWDGVDQAAHDPNSNRMRITVTYLDKNNKEKTQTYTSNALAMGWNISDEHFKTWKESMNSGSGKKVIVYAGNLGEGQGLHKIVPQTAKLLGNKFEFLIIGDGGTKRLLQTEIEKIKKLLASPKNIIIVPHKNPDGDAMGSTVGLFHYLKQFNHNATVISPNDYPNFLKWIPGNNQVLIHDYQTE